MLNTFVYSFLKYFASISKIPDIKKYSLSIFDIISLSIFMRNQNNSFAPGETIRPA